MGYLAQLVRMAPCEVSIGLWAQSGVRRCLWAMGYGGHEFGCCVLCYVSVSQVPCVSGCHVLCVLWGVSSVQMCNSLGIVCSVGGVSCR